MTYSEHIKIFFPNGTEGYSYEQILASMDLDLQHSSTMNNLKNMFGLNIQRPGKI